VPANDEYKRFGQPDQPVVGVNWFEAIAYCRWLTKKLGEGRWLFALPSDAEWEKAARGPDGFDYGLGRSVSENQVKLYNWKKNPSAEVTVVGLGLSRTSYRPNRYGLYHASGNAAEWSGSVYRPHSRSRPYSDDERNHDDTLGRRSVRGGSWYSASTATIYIAYREAFQPEVSTPYLGFRVVARPLP
jgi:formylglycine-generating enzyme required for sulfatase activity